MNYDVFELRFNSARKLAQRSRNGQIGFHPKSLVQPLWGRLHDASSMSSNRRASVVQSVEQVSRTVVQVEQVVQSVVQSVVQFEQCRAKCRALSCKRSQSGCTRTLPHLESPASKPLSLISGPLSLSGEPYNRQPQPTDPMKCSRETGAR